MSEANKTPRAKVESADAGTSIEPKPAPSAGEGKSAAGTSGSTSAPSGGTAFSRIGDWVSRTFPGTENAFWGGVCGLLIALLFFAVGLLKTLMARLNGTLALIVALIVLVGVALGQMADGDPKIINALRRFFSANN